MQDADSLVAALEQLVGAFRKCEQLSILDDLGDIEELKRLKNEITFYDGKELTLTAWIRSASARFDVSRVDNKKRERLSNDVGDATEVYIASAIVVVMWNFQISSLVVV